MGPHLLDLVMMALDDEQFILDASQPGRTVTLPGGVTDNDLKSLRNNLTR